MDNIIRLITTEGCEGCAIAERLIEKAISVAEVEIHLEVIDCLDPYYYDFIRQNNITDYPTTLYIVKQGDVNNYLIIYSLIILNFCFIFL